jgi:hypothetical protein
MVGITGMTIGTVGMSREKINLGDLRCKLVKEEYWVGISDSRFSREELKVLLDLVEMAEKLQNFYGGRGIVE